MRLAALVPMACAIVTFVLSMLCLFAGHKRGFMEDYHIITLNTSTLGHDLVPTSTSSAGSTATSAIGSIISGLTHSRSLLSDIENDLKGIEGDIADKLAADLGIKQWYSLHLMDMCEGTYTPNATAKGAHLNVSSCSNQTAMYHFDISTIIGNELNLGPLHLNLSDISWPSSIQSGLNDLNTAMDATFVLYCIGIAAAGLSILSALLAIFLTGRLFSFLNWSLTSLSFTALLIASIIITVLQKKAANEINKYGNDIGVFAYKGKKFLVLTWVATAVIFLASCMWVGVFCVGRRNERREYTEKRGIGKKQRGSYESEEFARRG